MHIAAAITQCLSRAQPTALPGPSSSTRFFSATSAQQNYLAPKAGESRKSRKGRCRVPTGGSMRGTTVVWGDYGLRMRDHDRRISAQQLKIAEDTIRKRLRGMKFIMYMRIAANIGVYTSGNDVRMGKGKGSFDRWTARVAVSKIIFEIQGDLHEQVVRDAFRLAGAKLPGMFLSLSRHLGLRDDVKGCVLTVSRTVRIRQEGRPPRHGHNQAGKRHHSGGPQEAAQAAAAGADGGTDSCCCESAVGAVVKQTKRERKRACV